MTTARVKAWPVKYTIHYQGKTYYRFHFPAGPFIVIKQGLMQGRNPG